MKSNIVFSISEGMIKFLQVGQAPKKPVLGAEVIDIERQSDEQISRALSVFVKKAKINFAQSRVTVLVPRSRVILRHMMFPSQNEGEIRSMIDLQVGSRIPYARQEVEIDFQILTKSPDGYAKVVVVIIPQEIAGRYWKIFSDAKVPVHQMTISSVGLWQFYLQQPDLSQHLGALIDLDVNHSEVCLCARTHWLNSREIPVGFTQMQQDGYDEFIKQWELTRDSTGLEKLPGNVETSYLVSTANRAYALGIEMVKAQEGLTVKDVHLTQVLNLGRGVKWSKLFTEDGVSLAPLAGIALSSGIPPIDLVPGSVRQAQEQRVYQRQLVILGIWVMAALISLALASGMGYFRKNVQLSRLENQLLETKSEARKVEAQLQKINDIESIFKGRLIFSGLARQIDHLLPSQVYLVSFSITDGNILSVQGMSSNSVAINQFQRGMVNTSSFSNVSLDYVNKRVTQQGEADYFKITCILKSVSKK